MRLTLSSCSMISFAAARKDCGTELVFVIVSLNPASLFPK
jgi:hypothetical protein